MDRACGFARRRALGGGRRRQAEPLPCETDNLLARLAHHVFQPGPAGSLSGPAPAWRPSGRPSGLAFAVPRRGSLQPAPGRTARRDPAPSRAEQTTDQGEEGLLARALARPVPGKQGRRGDFTDGALQVGQRDFGGVGELVPGDPLAGVLVSRGGIDGQPAAAAQLDKNRAVEIGVLLLRRLERPIGAVYPVRARGAGAAEDPACRRQQDRRGHQ